MSVTHTELSDVASRIDNGMARFGIGVFTNKTIIDIKSRFEVIPLAKSHFIIACSHEMGCFNNDYIEINDIYKYPLVLHDDTFITSALSDIFGDLNRLNVFMYSNDNALIKQTVKDGRAISIHSDFLIRKQPEDNKSDGIKYIPIKGNTPQEKDSLELTFILIYDKNTFFTNEEKDFVNLLLTITKDL